MSFRLLADGTREILFWGCLKMLGFKLSGPHLALLITRWITNQKLKCFLMDCSLERILKRLNCSDPWLSLCTSLSWFYGCFFDFCQKEGIKNVQLTPVSIPKYIWINTGRWFTPEMLLCTAQYGFLLLSIEDLIISFSQAEAQCNTGRHSH